MTLIEVGEERRRLIKRFTGPHSSLNVSLEQEEARRLLSSALEGESAGGKRAARWVKAVDHLESLSKATRMRVACELVTAPEHVRVETYRSMRESWVSGVTYQLSDLPELNGYGGLVASLASLSHKAIDALADRVARLGLLTPNESSHVPERWSLEAGWLAKSAEHQRLERLLCALEAVSEVDLAVVIRLVEAAMWIQALMGQPGATLDQRGCPSSRLALELLSCSWFRGMRRRGSRELGRADEARLQGAQELSVPTCLRLRSATRTALDDEINRRLAPLRLEWLSALSRAVSKDEPAQRLLAALGPTRCDSLRRELSTLNPPSSAELSAWLDELIPERESALKMG